MTNAVANLVLSQLGYTVCSETLGVYHLRRVDADSAATDSVALFYCPGPVDQVDRIKFIEFDLTGIADREVTIPKIIRHWALLDARRIEESGVSAYSIPRIDFGHVAEGDLTYPRPDSDRLRHAVRMSTGEVLCYN